MADEVGIQQLQNGVDVTTGQPRDMQLGGATIDIVAADSTQLGATRMGLWDNAFRDDGSLFTDEDERNHFIGADTRRFYIQVNDPAAPRSCTIRWTTFDAAGNEIDASQAKTLTLEQMGSGVSLYRSKALMIVADADDRGVSGERLRRADVGGKLVVSYPDNASRAQKELPIFSQADRKAVTLQIHIASNTLTGNSIVDLAANGPVWTHLRRMREIYARIGITVKTVCADSVAQENIHRQDGDVVARLVIANPSGVDAERKRQILGTVDKKAGAIQVLYIDTLAQNNCAEASASNAGELAGSLFMVCERRPYTLAHEIGHILTDKPVVGGDQATAHYRQPTAAGTRLLASRNLMALQTSDTPSFSSTKRLWDADDGAGFNQVAKILASSWVGPP